MGVGVENNGIVLVYDEKFVESISDEFLHGCFEHEIDHLILEHMFRGVWHFSGESNFKLVKKDLMYLWNICCDLVINPNIPEIIKESKKEKTQYKGVFPDLFELPNGLTAEQYFYKLVPRIKQDKITLKLKGNGKGQLQLGNGESQNSQGNPESGKDKNGRNEEVTLFSDYYIEDKDGNKIRIPKPLDDCANWKSKEETDSDDNLSLDKELVKQQLKEAYRKSKENSQDAGLGLSPFIKEILDKLISPKQIPWWVILNNVISNSERYITDITWSRINRRLPDLIPGIRKNPVLNIVIYGDQSSSISDQSCREFFAEMKIIRKTKKMTATFYPYDTTIDEKNSQVFDDYKDIKMIRTRSGGTCFGIIAEHIQKMKVKPDLCIIMTDGYLYDYPSWDKCPKPKVPCFTLLTHDSEAIVPKLWGRWVKLTPPGEYDEKRFNESK